MRNNHEDGKFYGLTIETLFRLRKMEWIPIDGDTLDIDSPPYVEINPAGAINLRMPAVDDTMKGLAFLISNISANVVTLQTSGGAGFTTAIVLAAGESTIAFCTGSATAALGWRAIATAPST